MGVAIVLLNARIRDAVRAVAIESDFGTSVSADTSPLESKRCWGCVSSPTHHCYDAGGVHVSGAEFEASSPVLRRGYGVFPVGVITCLLPRLVRQFG